MAFAHIREALGCSICLNVYSYPVGLRCGHNFCQACIDRVLDAQEESGVYSCPECRAESEERPALVKNIPLCNVLGRLASDQRDREETGILCTYCVDYRVSAAKSCLLCEASLCDRHLRVHSKSSEHVLCDPTDSMQNRKCSVHNEVLRYYCTKDGVCICASCSSASEHQGHPVEMLDEASTKKKNKLKNLLKVLTTKREETEKQVQRLQKRHEEDKEKAALFTVKVNTMFRDLNKRVLSEISRQENCDFDLIMQLEIKKDMMSKRIRYLEELCNKSDPVPVLQAPDTVDLWDTEDIERHKKQVQAKRELDKDFLSLHTISDTIAGIYTGIYVHELTDIQLDINTAANHVCISNDLKTASSRNIFHDPTSQRFSCYQVLSSNRFSSGRLCWEVEVSKTGSWRVGMCYPGLDRNGEKSYIGENKKSWCLCGENSIYLVKHDRKETWLPPNTSSNNYRFRIYLDYEAGELSFYALCDPIRHMHTFFAAFTEPLHAALWIGYSASIKISEKAGSAKN